MARRTAESIPDDPPFLQDLGLKRTATGQYVQIADGKSFYEFRQYKHDMENQKKFEAIHKAVANDIFDELTTLGVKQYYLHADGFAHEMEVTKPAKPSIRILSTDKDALVHQGLVYLVVGDSKQALATWSRKILMTEGGIEGGSAVGLVRKLRGLATDTTNNDNDTVKAKESDLPGIVVLNPGELLYSYRNEGAFTQADWQNRDREHGFSHPYKITDANKVSGHATSAAHISTFMHQYLNKITSNHASVRVIAIGDGGEEVLRYLDRVLTDQTAPDYVKRLGRMALVAPSHTFKDVSNNVLRTFLHNHARAWEPRLEPKGAVLAKCHLPSEFNTKIREPQGGQWTFIGEGSGWQPRIPATTLPSLQDLASLPSLEDPNFGFKSPNTPERYLKEEVLCDVVSAGIEDVGEAIFPAVIDEVLNEDA